MADSTRDKGILKAVDLGDGTFADAVALQGAANAACANVASSAADTVILAANPSRNGAILHNDSTAILYLKYGTGASSTSYTYKVAPDAHWEMAPTIYTGQVNGRWASVNGAARVTEVA